MPGTSNVRTQKTLDQLRADTRFRAVAIAERFVAFPPPGHRQDLFGIVDVIALGPGITLAVQTTSKAQIAAHVKKLRENENTVHLLEAGWLLEIWGWHQPKGPGTRWVCETRRFEINSEGATDGR